MTYDNNSTNPPHGSTWNIKDVQQNLQQHPLFSDVTESFVRRAVKVASFKTGRTIMYQDRLESTIYVLISGAAKETAVGIDGTAVIRRLLKSGNSCGECEAWLGLRRQTQVKALRPTVCAVISTSE